MNESGAISRVLNFYELKLNHQDPVYQQVALYVKRQIWLGRASSGDKLPSRREIAARLGINPNTAQKAFKLMEDEGYVRTSSTLGSVLHVDKAIRARIGEELTRELVKPFVEAAKEMQLSFPSVVELIGKHWD